MDNEMKHLTVEEEEMLSNVMWLIVNGDVELERIDNTLEARYYNHEGIKKKHSIQRK